MTKVVSYNSKEVSMYLSMDEADNLSDELKRIIKGYKEQGFKIIKYVGGHGDLAEAIKKMINNHI